ncbi:MAG: sugar transferase [Hyphomicrobiales bacterium]
MAQRFVITGASGFIGSQLVPRLKALDCDLLLVGRDTKLLDQIFPDTLSCSYDEIAKRAQGFDALIHLAVLNNNVRASADQFIGVNVNFLSQVIASAKSANIQRFVNVTTFHAVDGSRSNYAHSKRLALQMLEKEEELSIVNVFLPVVYGDSFAGNFSLFNKAPVLIKPLLLTLLTAALPTLHVDRFSSFIAHKIKNAPSKVLLANPQEENPVFRSVKRAMDLLFCVAVITILGWFLLAVWLLVYTTSSGPGIFAQKRVGLNGKLFTCYKFRTMQRGTKQAGTHEVTSSSVTQVGSFLRKTKIDELPQVWNILRGEMSLVGPRPCMPSQNKLVRERKQLGVLSVLPGITGLSQINGVDMRSPEILAQMDARYIAQRGLFAELKIIALTMLGKGGGDCIDGDRRSSD